MVEVFPGCRSREISSEFQRVLESGWNQVAAILQGIGVGEIAKLKELEISLLDDGEMARIHGEFLQDATPTDVITFEHGELLIGVEEAQKQAVEFGTSPDREIALYGIHGMLHLAGFDDRDPADARIMSLRQEELLLKVFPGL